jgi:protein-tyrosine-phosphatase
MAAGLLKRDLGPDAERVVVDSAGTAAWDGQPATEPSVEVAAREGVDLKSHRSRRLTPALLREADLVLVMERGHLTTVRTLGADAARAHILSEYPPPGDPSLPVSDPFGASIEAYEECWRRIQTHLNRVVPVIREAQRVRGRNGPGKSEEDLDERPVGGLG